MRKSTKRKPLLALFSFLILIGLSLAYVLNSGKNNQRRSYIDVKSTLEARTVEELKLMDPPVDSKARLHTAVSLPQTSKWYLGQLAGTGWILDVPPQNTSDEQIQMIQLRKGVETLSISLINDGMGGTDVIFEKVGDQNAGEEGKDP